MTRRRVCLLHAAALSILLLGAVAGCGKDKKAPTQPGNTAPVASFTLNPSSGTPATLFSVDASGSSDAQDAVSALQVRWDWESDGVWDTGFSTVKTAGHQYPDTGRKTIRLEVKDTEGLTGTTTRVAAVGPVPPPPEGFVAIPAGTFTMGSPSGELGRYSSEVQHQVTLTRTLYVSKFEVTQDEWQSVMGWNESGFPGARRPVETVTWFDAVKYCNERSTREGKTPVYELTGVITDGNHIQSAVVTANFGADGYRLLTEAEWEYACRAGSTTAFYNGEITNTLCEDPVLDQVAWYCGTSPTQTQDVGTKVGNAWDLYDMHGNVFEWCWDWYGDYSTGSVTDPTGPSIGAERVARGGYWNYSASGCRSANRFSYRPSANHDVIGLRVARAAQ